MLYQKQDKCTSASKKKEIQKSINVAKADLKRISEDVHMLSQLSEMETLKIFKRKVYGCDEGSYLYLFKVVS